MDAEQFQKAVGTRERDRSKLTSEQMWYYICTIIEEISVFSEAAENIIHYSSDDNQLSTNVQITDNLCFVLTLLAEYASFKGFKFSELMTRAIQLRNQRYNDVDGVN